LRFSPCQGRLKGIKGFEEPVGGWQRDLFNEVLRRCDSTPVEGCDSARERVDEAAQLPVRKCPVDVSVSFRLRQEFPGASTHSVGELKRLDYSSDVTVLENRTSALPRTAYGDIYHGPGQVVGPNHLVGEQQPKSGVDRA
jgi:hypothetical protein